MKRWSRSYFEDNKRQNTSVTFFLSSRVPGLKYNKIRRDAIYIHIVSLCLLGSHPKNMYCNYEIPYSKSRS